MKQPLMQQEQSLQQQMQQQQMQQTQLKVIATGPGVASAAAVGSLDVVASSGAVVTSDTVADDGGSWSVVAARHRPIQPIRKIVGAKVASSSSKLVAATSGPKSWHVFVGGLGKDVVEGDIGELLTDVGIKTCEIRRLKPTQAWMERSSAFRVSVEATSKDAVMDPAIWPDSVIVRDWFFKPK